MKQATIDKLQPYIDDLTPDLVPMVDNIEQGVKTTQNNYGPYMSLLQQLAGQDTTMLYIVSEALYAANANRNGVRSALRILVQ